MEDAIELMPEGETYVPIDFGPCLVGLFHASRERPTLLFSRPGEMMQLGRLDPFPVKGVPRGHYHVLPRKAGGDQIPFEDEDGKTIFELALGYMEPDKFRDVLREADAADIAELLSDDDIRNVAQQYREQYERLAA